ncbi:ABC transporter substrate-binding protein [Aquabacterium sp. J223]|uniref:ABC transporter substrate-binding protein n=1 Tax=Aquabacterium sp. J223 TaxID=2898431 RepID=UPI0021AE0955|nr:ABC transporter substrate-binding protein [Aquabacterium sp. J223]UUX96154.1 ABC transporter substrate-binding protein [Aquabacterium sp. J223]
MPATSLQTLPRPGRRAALGVLGTLPLAGLGALGLPLLAPHRPDASHGQRMTFDHQLGWVKGIQFGGYLAALDRGFLAEEGLDVRYVAGGPGTDYRTLVASGRALVSESNVAGMIDGALRGQPLVAFAAVMQRDPGAIISPASRPIRSLQDMVGKTLGVPNSVRAQLQPLIRAAGIDPAQVRLVPVGSDPSLLASGQVDGYYSWSTTAVPALRRIGFEPHWLHVSDLGVPGYGQLLIARRDTLAAHRDVLVRYTRALIRGWSWVLAHPVAAAEMVVRRHAPPGTDLAEQVAQARMMRDYIVTADAKAHGLLWLEPAVFERAIAMGRQAGSVPADARLDVAAFVTQDIVRAAQAPAAA